ncbi:thioredoxin family protein [Peribacillus sp. Hz7]|uniref:thioredoxin family protein n=1 Tax=Peribacillus sp. Hz7 TaxID=3344873 RepID=UPI0035C9FCA8
MQDWTETDVQAAARQGDTFCVYAYTPMCGTCQVASKMLTVALELVPQLTIGKMNVNFFPSIAKHCEIESVPCLLLYKEGKLIQKIYAFQSVPYLYTTLKEFLDN